MNLERNTRDRYAGCPLGLAAGDALGTTLEFQPPGSFSPLTDMVGGGPFHLRPGEWTDDTSMALCLATSLVECQGFDAKDQMSRYVRWRREGYLSSNGRCFDIGITVSGALQRFEQSGDPFAVESLEAALWAFHHSNDFRSGALLAVNLGDDADTTGAVYGQLAGACYGSGGIPTGWRARLAMSETIATLAGRLYQLAGWVRSTGAH